MWALRLMIAAFAALMIAACGSTDSTYSEVTKRAKPDVEIPEGPEPKELVVRDIEEGSGPVAKSGDKIIVDYVGVYYKTGLELESSWQIKKPSVYQLDNRELVKGWELGVEGMRVGSRRELIVPSHLAYETGAIIYVIDLLGVK